MGDNSIFKQASNAKLETELAKIEEKAGLIYSDKLLEKVSNDLKDRPTMQEIVDELKNQGDKIEQVSIDGDGVTGISLDRETMTLGFGGTNKIKVTLERSDTTSRYYAVVEGKYYEMHFNNGIVTIDRKASEISNEGTKKTLNISSSDETVATAILEESTNIITVTATNKAGTNTITVTYGSYIKTCEVTVRDIPITTAIELNSVRARIATGYTRWLTAITTPTDALQEFEWSSSDKEIATVDNKGVITAKREGTVTITAKTIDGSNKEGSCEVTVVENAVDVGTLTQIQTGESNKIAKDENGNLITVPVGFKVLTSEGTKVTQGIVIQDEEGNEFVWVPVDSVSTGVSKPADDIRLGRYEDFETKNVAGNYVPKQDADNYTQSVCINSYYYETSGKSDHINAKNLGEFVTKTKANGGCYIGRYEASGGSGNMTGTVKSQYDKVTWVSITQATAATNCQNMYQGNSFIESDLLNSYVWDTVLVFIQKYSGNSNYANNMSVNNSSIGKLNTGRADDEVCNIHDIASNCMEWSTEYCINSRNPYSAYWLSRGGCYYNKLKTSSRGTYDKNTTITNYTTFRPFIYLK